MRPLPAPRPPSGRLLASVLALAAAAGLGACAAGRTATEPVEGVFDARTGRVVDFEDMVEDLATVRVVYVGETHTNPEHHDIQLRVLEALAERKAHLILGLEMLQRPYDPVLDRWAAGEMDEGAFLREVHWYDQWSDWNLYGPLLRAARDRKIRVVGLQLPDLGPGGTISREIAKSGLAGIPPWMRSQLPEEIDTGVKAHRSAIRAIYFGGGHPIRDRTTAEEGFRRFYEVQCTWDETMAESGVQALEAAPPDASLLVLAGGMHVKDFLAIPERMRRRNGLDYRVVLPMEREEFPEGGFPVGMGRPADYVLYTDPAPPPSDGRLGVGLRGGDSVVERIVEGGTAWDAGLREGDRLLSIDGSRVADGVDLRLLLEGIPKGASVQLRWRREGVDQEGSAVLRALPPQDPAGAPPK